MTEIPPRPRRTFMMCDGIGDDYVITERHHCQCDDLSPESGMSFVAKDCQLSLLHKRPETNTIEAVSHTNGSY